LDSELSEWVGLEIPVLIDRELDLGISAEIIREMPVWIDYKLPALIDGEKSA
jgi:hypothetical protein